MDVCHVLPGKLGGVVGIVANLLRHRDRRAGRHSVVLTNNRLDDDTDFEGTLDTDQQSRFRYCLPVENVRAVFRRLHQIIPPGPGALVSHDWIELGMIECHPTERTVFQVLHGDHDYYYDLASKHEAVIDAHVAYSRAMHDRLLARLPHRKERIFHVPYGIPLNDKQRQPKAGPLRLLFAGRMDHRQKGVFDLPAIDEALRQEGVEVAWTIVGDGPDAKELWRRWTHRDYVRALGRRPNEEVRKLAEEHDVFVLPTRAEGFPVALLEAMSAGLVPVVSKIESGVPEVVTHGVTGFLAEIGGVDGFAEAIALLARDRDRLEVMSQSATAVVAEQFDIRERIKGYEALFARSAELRQPRKGAVRKHYLSRLDRAWLPNPLVYSVRAASRLMRGQRIR